MCDTRLPLSLHPVHNTPGEFENGGSSLPLGLPSTLIRHENGAFRKNALQTGGFALLCEWRTLCERSFSKTKTLRYSLYSPARVLLQDKSKMTSDCCVFQFLRSSVNGKYLMRFCQVICDVIAEAWGKKF